MKAKTIKQVLAKVHSDWTDSITNLRVRKLARTDTIITGGCIASMLLKEPVNDYDIYFTTKEAVLALTHYYIKEFTAGMPSEDVSPINILDMDNRISIQYSGRSLRPMSKKSFKFDEGPETEIEDDEPKAKFRPVYLSANAITLSHKVQLVIRFYGDAATIHENYDFEHCKCYWTSKDKQLVLPAKSLEALLTRELVYTGSLYPLASIIRSRKFIQRGFSINAGQYLKMCLQLNDYDLRNLSVLEDQLIGMDALYFAQMLAAIPPERKVDNRIDMSYLMTMIDRFF